MSLAGFLDFLIVIFGLGIIGGMTFAAIEYISPDVRFRTIARFAVGGAIILALLQAIRAVFGGGGPSVEITSIAVLQFAIGLILILLVWVVICWLIDWWFSLGGTFAPGLAWPGTPPAPAPAPAPAGPAFIFPLKYVLAAVVLVAILMLAAQILFGADLIWSGISFAPRRPLPR